MLPINQVVSEFKPSIFSSMTQLALQYEAINLAQGFPDFDGPEWVLQKVTNVFQMQKNQYAPSYGQKNLLEAISKNYFETYNLNYSAQGEILVTNGATEAIYCALAALVNKDDEVVLFEPFYDSYLACAKLVGAEVKAVTLHEPDFSFDRNELKKAITNKTKLLILNQPHNPSGRVFNEDEIKFIVQLAEQYGFYILSDEVYEYLSFSQKHRPLANYESIKEQVITISSVGKTLSLTGWKIGWACGNAKVIQAMHHVHQFLTFCVAHPLQEIIAQTLNESEIYSQYLQDLKKSYLSKRDLLTNGLIELGYSVVKTEGTYFTLVKTPSNMTDFQFGEFLIKHKKVAVIPTSAFYLNSKQGEKYIRFCFAKQDRTLQTALKNLGDL